MTMKSWHTMIVSFDPDIFYKLIPELSIYAKKRRIRRIILCPSSAVNETVESPFEWVNPTGFHALFDHTAKRAVQDPAQLVLVFRKRFELLHVPFWMIAQSEIHHCSPSHIRKSLYKADAIYRQSEQRLGR